MTQESKHTPGPWEVGSHPASPDSHIVRPVLFGSRVTVLPVNEGGHVSLHNIADARLIAAAPELLAAARGLISADSRDNHSLQAGPEFCDAVEALYAAIAKATDATP